jgi:nickel-dependent lactate racemase
VLGADVEEAVDPEAVLRGALAASGAEFDSFLAQAASPLLVVVNDGTRPTPSAEVLAILRPALEEWWKSPGNELSFVIATGTHRAALPEEVERILGIDFAAAHADRISCHDSQDKDGLVCLARTTRGTPVWVNRSLADAESVILINSVEPHYFAGYTGGRKSLFPGLALPAIRCMKIWRRRRRLA